MIARMEHVEILCLRDAFVEVVASVQSHGLLHIEEVPLAVDDAAGYLHRVHLSDEQQREKETFEELARMLEELRPLLATIPAEQAVVQARAELDEQAPARWHRALRGYSRELRSLVRRRGNVHDNLSLLAKYDEALEAIAPLVRGRDVRFGIDARVFVLKGDIAQVMNSLVEDLDETIGKGYEIVQRKTGRETVVVALVYAPEHNHAVELALRGQRISPVDLPDKSMEGQPFGDVFHRIHEAAEEQRASLREIEAAIARFSEEHGATLAAMRLVVRDQMNRLNVLRQCAQSEMLAVVRGWAPQSQVDAFAEAMDAQFGDRVMINRLPVHRADLDRVPTLLQNPPLLRPFEVLLSLFQPPTYGTLDPSVLVGIFFVLFYGFILGDVGYGLAIILFCLALRRRLGHYAAVRDAAMVGIYAGVSSIVFGIVFGEFLGDIGTRYFGMQPLWFHRGHDPVRLLLIAVAVGAGHVVLSLVLGVRENLRRLEKKHACEKIALLAGGAAVGIGVLALAGAWPLGTPVAVALVVFLGLLFLGLMIYAAGAMAAVQLLELTSIITNVLSYSRLMALGILSVALADLANELAHDAGSVWAGVPIALALHLLNIGIGLFSPTIHALRLNYVESLPKFYAPAGRFYQPFKKEALW